MRGNLQRLHHAWQLSQAIHHAARRGDWDGVESLECERRPVLESAFAGEALVEEETVAQRLIDRILELDRQVVGWATQARSSIADELSSLNRGKRVVKAYRATGR